MHPDRATDPTLETGDTPQGAETAEDERPRPRRHRRLYDLLFVAGFVAVLGLFLFGNRLFSPPPPTQVAVGRELAGTWVSITAYAARTDEAKSAIEAAFTRMRSVLELAAGADSTRELRRLNAQGQLTDPSKDLWAMVTAAIADARRTNGAFDPTAAPLKALWSTPSAQGTPFSQLPAATRAQEIADALARVGADRIELRTDPREIVLAPGTTIDLQGIATGYAVDQGLAALEDAGLAHALITAGTVTGAMGGRPDGTPWQAPLRDPHDGDRIIVQFALEDGAIATVGDPGRDIDPSRPIPQVIDPRTGTPATDSSSATVIAPTATQAQPLAVAAFVLGPEAGMTLIDALPDSEALLVGSADPKTLHRSAGLAPYLNTKDGT